MNIKEVNDKDLVLKIKNESCNDSYLELCRRYENVFYKICQKYSQALKNSGVNPDDLYKEKDFILWSCACNYDPDRKTKLSTHIGNHARYVCLNSINSRRLLVNFDNQEIKDFIEDSQKSSYDTDEDPYQYDELRFCYEGISDERLKRIIELRYFQDKKLTWRTISEKMNISIQTAISLHNRVLNILRDKIKDKDNL